MAGGVTASMQLEAQNGREKEVEKGGRDGRARMPASAPELAVATARQPAAVAAEGSCPRGGGAPLPSPRETTERGRGQCVKT